MRFTLFLLAAMAAACGSGSNAGTATDGADTPIHAVQGAGAASSLDGQSVTVAGIVTGDFQEDDTDDSRNLGGFYLQGDPDGDPATSDAVFVFDGMHPATDVAVGDLLRVEGTVQEYFGETQIAASQVTVLGDGRVEATAISLPASSLRTNSDGERIPDLERYEGMLLRFSQALTVAEHRQLQRFGEMALAAGGRPYQYTSRNSPDVAGYGAYRDDMKARLITLDDGSRVENAAPIRFRNRRVGDSVQDLSGVLRYSRGSGGNGVETYRLMPTAEPQFTVMNPRPAAPSVDGALRIASFNVLNLFSTLDNGRPLCGPNGNADCRGADSKAELRRQLGKTVSALSLLDADIVGLIEIENNVSASLQMLVDAMNTVTGAGRYNYVDAGTIGDDTIKTGLLYKVANVRPIGTAAILDSTADAGYDDGKNRPALAHTFAQISNNAKLTVVVNHFKSKGSDCDDADDPNVRDGQGNCGRTRTNAATALARWLATDPTRSNDADFLIIGDLNAYTLEDPVTALRSAGYSNLADSWVGLDSYSFNFDGMSGALDHALTSASLTPQVAGFLEWHINADEPRLLDYNLDNGRDPDLFDSATPYRASDHDPIIIGLDLTE